MPTVLRRLDDGSDYRIVKVFHEPSALEDELTAYGWTAQVRELNGNILGIAKPPDGSS